MTAKEFLNQYLDADRALDCKLEQLARLRAKAAKVTAIIGGERVQGGIDGSRLEAIAEKIMDLEREIDQDINQLKEKQSKVEAMILRLNSAREMDILTNKYIFGVTWDDIALFEGCTKRQIFRIHGNALKKIEKFLKMSSKGE